MFVRLLVSNSREAIGNIGLSGKIERVDWTPLILEILRADMDGVVFWEDSRYRDMVLQTQPDEVEE
jgi:hypothetical protein